MRKLRVLRPSVMSLNAVGTLARTRPLKKCYRVGSIGLLCLKMPLSFARLV